MAEFRHRHRAAAFMFAAWQLQMCVSQMTFRTGQIVIITDLAVGAARFAARRVYHASSRRLTASVNGGSLPSCNAMFSSVLRTPVSVIVWRTGSIRDFDRPRTHGPPLHNWHSYTAAAHCSSSHVIRHDARLCSDPPRAGCGHQSPRPPPGCADAHAGSCSGRARPGGRIEPPPPRRPLLDALPVLPIPDVRGGWSSEQRLPCLLVSPATNHATHT